MEQTLCAGLRFSEGKLATKFLGTGLKSLVVVRVYLDCVWHLNGSQQRRKRKKALDDITERNKKQRNERNAISNEEYESIYVAHQINREAL